MGLGLVFVSIQPLCVIRTVTFKQLLKFTFIAIIDNYLLSAILLIAQPGIKPVRFSSLPTKSFTFQRYWFDERVFNPTVQTTQIPELAPTASTQDLGQYTCSRLSRIGRCLLDEF